MICKSCKQKKPKYYSYARCKECVQDATNVRLRGPEGRRKRQKYKKYQQEYYRKWYKTNGRYRAVDYQEAIHEWQKRNPEKVQARLLIKKALKEGKLIKPNNCSQCNRETRLSGHHPDYTKPLEVLWLCGSCHKLEHNSTA